jgi:heat shock protein HslJ
MNPIKILLLIASSLFIAGCASTPKSITGNFALVSVTDASVSVDEPIIIHLRDTSIAGSGPVNQWQASINDGEIGPIIATRRAGPPESMQIEANLLAALQGAEFELDKYGKLTFKKKRKVTAVFQYVDIDPTASSSNE